MNGGYTVAWVVWLVLFAVIEGMALADRRPGDSLSEHLRKWFALEGKPPGWRVRRLALAGVLLYLCLHLLAGWV